MRLARVKPDLLGRIIDLFLACAPERVETLQAAHRHGDAGAVERAAHALRSSAGNFGAARLVELTNRIEGYATSGDTTPRADLIAAAVREVERLRDRLEQLRREV